MIQNWTIPVFDDITSTFDVDVTPHGNKFKITFPYNGRLVQEVKNLEGAKWDADSKHWTVSNTERNVYSFIYLCTGKHSYYIKRVECEIKRPLFKHQIEGVKFAIARKYAMLAMEMGLGKTLTMIEVMENIYRLTNKFIWWVIAPYGAQQEWHRQLKNWDASITPVKFITYESLEKWLVTIDENDLPDGVIFDESIKIKTPMAKRSQVAKELCRLIRQREGYIYLLSGAPTPKNPADWWHQIECLQPGFIREPSINKFVGRYAQIEYQQGEYGKFPKVLGWKETELRELSKRLSKIVFFQSKDKCFDLPSKIFERIKIRLPKQVIQTAQCISALSTNGLQLLEKLHQLSDGFQYEDGQVTWIHDYKIQEIEKLLDFYAIGNGGPGRLVIYAAYHASIDFIIQTCTSKKWVAARIDGRGWSDKEILDKFESDSDSDICIVAHPGSVYGLTLSKTLALVYYSNTFIGDHRTQSLERRDRPGMDTTKGTRIIDLIGLFVDEKILDNLTNKRKIELITLGEIQELLTA